MNDKLASLLEKIQELERELLAELRKKEKQFSYEVNDRQVHFTAAVAAQHRKLAKTFRVLYVNRRSSMSSHPRPLGDPGTCCPAPHDGQRFSVRLFSRVLNPESAATRLHRHGSPCAVIPQPAGTAELRILEYTNGILAYVQEIAGRTEQYWCPIKHAIGLKTRHSRYKHFLDFGDAEQYRQRIEQVRRDFEGIRKQEQHSHSADVKTSESKT